MKTVSYCIFFLMFFLSPFLNGQVSEIDPRQYITIFEQKSDLSPMEAIVWGDSTDIPLRKGKKVFRRGKNHYFVPNKKYNLLDTKTKLSIQFNRDSMARNIDLFGSVSLDARLGDNPIEVGGYSYIGEERTKIGVDYKPPKEIAENLMSFIFLANDIDSELYYFIRNLQSDLMGLEEVEIAYEQELADRKRGKSAENQIKSLVTELRKILKNSPNQDSLIDGLPRSLLFKVNELSYSLDNLSLSNLMAQSKNKAIKELRSAIEDIDENALTFTSAFLADTSYNRSILSEIDVELGKTLIKLKYIREKIELELLKYLNFFDESGQDTKNAYLSLSSSNKIKFNALYKSLINLNEELKKINIVEELKKERTITYLNQLSTILNELGSVEGSYLHQLLDTCHYELNFFKKGTYKEYLEKRRETNRAYYSDDDLYSEKLTEETSFWEENYLQFDYKVLDVLERKLAEAAGEIIYKKFILGTIDLERSNAQSGNKLYISVLWYPMGHQDSSKPIVLPLAEFDISKLGWQRSEISDGALLINRINEDLVRTNYPLVKSEFRPAGGASLLWTYYNDQRRYRLNKDGTEKEISGLRRFVKWLEPSFGINVSYVNFNQDETFEVGAGPIMGLFRNQIFITGGYNLHAAREQPFYFGIGFSFGNVYNNIKSNITKN